MPIMLIRLDRFVRMPCQPCLFACHATFSDTLVNEEIFYVTYLRVVELMCLLQAVLKRNVRTVMLLISSFLACRCTGKLITPPYFLMVVPGSEYTLFKTLNFVLSQAMSVYGTRWRGLESDLCSETGQNIDFTWSWTSDWCTFKR